MTRMRSALCASRSSWRRYGFPCVCARHFMIRDNLGLCSGIPPLRVCLALGAGDLWRHRDQGRHLRAPAHCRVPVCLLACLWRGLTNRNKSLRIAKVDVDWLPFSDTSVRVRTLPLSSAPPPPARTRTQTGLFLSLHTRACHATLPLRTRCAVATPHAVLVAGTQTSAARACTAPSTSQTPILEVACRPP
jgi:hypothetical protein